MCKKPRHTQPLSLVSLQLYFTNDVLGFVSLGDAAQIQKQTICISLSIEISQNATASTNTVTSFCAKVFHQFTTWLCFLGQCSTNTKNTICVTSPIEVHWEAKARGTTVTSLFAKILHQWFRYLCFLGWCSTSTKTNYLYFIVNWNTTKCHGKHKHCYQLFCKNTSPIHHLALLPWLMHHKQKNPICVTSPIEVPRQAQTLLPAFLHQ